VAFDLKRRVTTTSQIISFGATAGDAFAHLRANTNVKGADAVHLACAMTAGVDFFITNDTELQKLQLPGIGQITSAQLLTTL
jgi:predicted nucleic acid-binding protein